ncbi:MAG: hypothetical protein ABIF89_01700, partial [bacterium]
SFRMAMHKMGSASFRAVLDQFPDQAQDVLNGEGGINDYLYKSAMATKDTNGTITGYTPEFINYYNQNSDLFKWFFTSPAGQQYDFVGREIVGGEDGFKDFRKVADQARRNARPASASSTEETTGPTNTTRRGGNVTGPTNATTGSSTRRSTIGRRTRELLHGKGLTDDQINAMTERQVKRRLGIERNESYDISQ